MPRYSSAGKGDDRRPQQVSDEEFERRWNSTFRNSPERKPPCKLAVWIIAISLAVTCSACASIRNDVIIGPEVVVSARTGYTFVGTEVCMDGWCGYGGYGYVPGVGWTADYGVVVVKLLPLFR